MANQDKPATAAFPEAAQLRLPEGYLARVDATLKGGETRSAWLREAILNELQRREMLVADLGDAG
jgi:metal-responsive CopG/Arc/MetJ family transcriptional regulator